MKPLEPPPREAPQHRGRVLIGILAANLFGAAWLVAWRVFEAGSADGRALLFIGALLAPLATFLLIGGEWAGSLPRPYETERRRAPDGGDFVTVRPGGTIPRLRLSPDGGLLPARRGSRPTLLRRAGCWFAATIAALAGLLVIERLLVGAGLLRPAGTGAFALAALPFVLAAFACARHMRRRR